MYNKIKTFMRQNKTSFHITMELGVVSGLLLVLFLCNESILKNLTGLGPVVQSIVSLTSSLRVISLTVLTDSIYNILIFFAEKNVSSFCSAKATHIFSAKNFSIFAYHWM